LEQLQKDYENRVWMNRLWKTLETERVERDYSTETKAAQREFDEKKTELKDSLLAELEEKKRQIEHEYQSMDLSGDPGEARPMQTRKNLRRLAKDPLPSSGSSKRQRTNSPALNFRLTEAEIAEDLKIITQGRPSVVVSRPSQTGYGGNLVVTDGECEVAIESGGLVYDGKRYLRGQPVQVESMEIGRVQAIIQSVGSKEVRGLFYSGQPTSPAQLLNRFNASPFSSG
jgi:Sin3 histone deacetylase corepressor complex component SDS3